MAAATALLLAGCGLRGPIQLPPEEAAQQTTATAESGQGKPEGAAQKPHKGFGFSLFQLCILSHGEHDCVLGVDDEQVPLPLVLQNLNAVNCPNLRGKPKLVFIQACRGGILVFQFLKFGFY